MQAQTKLNEHTYNGILSQSFSQPRELFTPGSLALKSSNPKKDLLDDVSETEDIITRKKALERGDKLMTAFWDTMKAKTPQTKSGPSLAVTAAAVTAVTAAGVVRTDVGGSVPQKWDFSSSTNNIINVGDIGAKAATTIPAARKKTDGDKQQVPGPGGALSPKVAETCLQLLADAKEAYEGQGFALQADGAARLDYFRFFFVREGGRD